MLCPEIFLRDPPELIPSPFNVNASSPMAIPVTPGAGVYVNSKAAPFETVVPLSVVPNALL